MDEYEPDCTPYVEYRPVYVLLRDHRSERAAVVRFQKHRMEVPVAVCPTEEAARAALRLMLLEKNND